jgi:PAS domain S-box-containing protein
VDGSDERLAVELSGLPVFDRERSFRGYRGFGICRDVARLAALTQTRRTAPAEPPPARQELPAHQELPARHEPPAIREERPALSIVPSSPNVVPFRSSTPPDKAPSLTPVEHKAFGELASRLTARLRDAENLPGDPLRFEEPVGPAAEPDLPEIKPPQIVMPEPPPAEIKPAQPQKPPQPQKPAQPEPPRFTADGEDARQPINDQKPILDRLPVGVLVYRLDNLIYANRAFLDWTGYESLYELTEAGGLDALFVEPNAETPRADNGAKTLSIATNRGDQLPVEARLFSTPWNGESALVLMLAHASAPKTDDAAVRSAEAETRELRSVVQAASDGVILLDRDGRVLSLNPSAEALFGYQSEELGGLPFTGLFATENQRTALDSVAQAGTESATIDGHEVVGHTRDGRSIPLFMSIGPLAAGEKLCAVFRDITPWKNSQDDLLRAKQQAEKASSAKSEFLAKISHEIRTPLNAIIGFSEVMMEERFGAVGNERYKQYLKDIHTSGGHLISLLNDLLDLSKIEAGKLELTFASVELNELTQQCVALMQPQANRERIIIRTSLTQTLPLVVADARSVRQIVLNLLSNSIKFTGAGGQVIVSTALNDSGEVVLRVRDTGIGMSEKDIAIALEPFRQLATSARWGSSGTGLGLPLTKALAEANRATFSIKSAVNSGTLVEVSFPGARLAAE